VVGGPAAAMPLTATASAISIADFSIVTDAATSGTGHWGAYYGPMITVP
jgi:hypothetical protein